MGLQSPVEVSLHPCGAPMAGLHTLPWPSPPCHEQLQSPCSTNSPMAAIPQEPSVAPNARSDAPAWRGLLPLTQSSTFRISRKIRCRVGSPLDDPWSASFPCPPHQVISIFQGFYMDFLRANRLLTWRTSARGTEQRRRAKKRAAKRQAEKEALYLCYQSVTCTSESAHHFCRPLGPRRGWQEGGDYLTSGAAGDRPCTIGGPIPRVSVQALLAARLCHRSHNLGVPCRPSRCKSSVLRRPSCIWDTWSCSAIGSPPPGGGGLSTFYGALLPSLWAGICWIACRSASNFYVVLR